MGLNAQTFIMVVIFAIFFIVGILALFLMLYKKVPQGKALIKTGFGGRKVSFSGMFFLPVFHIKEVMDITVRRIEVERENQDGLICKDNIRADIKVAFFVRVNNTVKDVLEVASLIGVKKASDIVELRQFFDAKFSEALKTVGKQFDFVELYTDRVKFNKQIMDTIGTDLNGYTLDDCAIDYLEQTSLSHLDPNNILDSEGIKKITELTANQATSANDIQREKEKTIKQQDVSAKEAILELEKQQSEAEERQKREIANIKSREDADAAKVAEEERLKSEKAKIATDEELAIATENKERQVIVAQKSKERTDAIETERVDKERLLELTEKEKIVSLAEIEKRKAIEEQEKNIQDVIRERVMVEKEVVVEKERIKDTEAFATADRSKQVAITDAERIAEEKLITDVKSAPAQKESAELNCEQKIIEANAKLEASEKDAEAVKIMAAAKSEEEAIFGLSEARVIEAKAEAIEKSGNAKARVLEVTAVAEAKGTEAKAVALEKEGTAKANVLESTAQAEARGNEAKANADAKAVEFMASAKEKDGTAEADVMQKKYAAEANGIEEKANAMKLLDGVGREHEEFKLKLDKEKEIDLAKINIQRDIADAQASVINEALKTAKIDIVGGETMFFDKIVGSITQGKSVDRMVGNSEVLTDMKETFITGDQEYFTKQITKFVNQFGISSGDLKNLTLSSLLVKMSGLADKTDKSAIEGILSSVKKAGFADLPAQLLNS